MPTTPASWAVARGRRRWRARPRRSLRGPAPADRALRAPIPSRRRSRAARRPPPAPRPAGAPRPPARPPRSSSSAVSSESWTPVCRRVTSSRARASASASDSARVWASSSTSRSRRRSSCRPRSRSSAPARLSSARAPATRICSEPQRLVAPAATEERGAAGRKIRLDLARPTLAIGVAARAPRPGRAACRPAHARATARRSPRLRDLLGEARVLLAQIADLRSHLLPPLEQALGLALDLLHRLPQVGEPVLGLLDGRRLERRAGR